VLTVYLAVMIRVRKQNTNKPDLFNNGFDKLPMPMKDIVLCHF